MKQPKFKDKLCKFTKSKSFKVFWIYFALIFIAFNGLLNQTLICDNVLRLDRYDNMSLGEFMKESLGTCVGVRLESNP